VRLIIFRRDAVALCTVKTIVAPVQGGPLAISTEQRDQEPRTDVLELREPEPQDWRSSQLARQTVMSMEAGPTSEIWVRRWRRARANWLEALKPRRLPLKAGNERKVLIVEQPVNGG